MAGALGVVLTGTTVSVEGSHAVPVYVDNSLPIVGPARACVISTGEIPQGGGPPMAVRLAPVGTPAIGPAIPVYVVPGGGVLDTLAYTNKVKAIAPANLIAYWSMDDKSGSVALDESGNGRNGAYTAVTLNQGGIGDGRTSASFDGATSFNNVFGASFAAAFNNQEGSAQAWIQVSAAGVWSDAAQRNVLVFGADANNQIYIRKQMGANAMLTLYGAGGTFKTVGPTVGPATGWVHFGITWSKAADQFRCYINGVQNGSTQTGLGVWVGALAATTTIIGAQATTPSAVWNGFLAHVAVWTTPLSSAQMLSLASVP